MKKNTLLLLVFLLCSSLPRIYAQGMLDAFDSASGWKELQSDDAALVTSIVADGDGKCMKLEFDAPLAGFVGIQKPFQLQFPANYTFTFMAKTDLPAVLLEFTLLDRNARPLHSFKKTINGKGDLWQIVSFRQKELIGPYMNTEMGRPMKQPEMISIVALLPAHAKGVLYLDELQLIEKKNNQNDAFDAMAFASSSEKGFPASRVLDRSVKTYWKSAGRQQREHMMIDLGKTITFGGLKIAWDSVLFPKEFSISVSDNARNWQEVYSVKSGNNNISFIPLGETENRYIKVNLQKSNSKDGYIIKEIGILPVDFSGSMLNVYAEVKRMFPKGSFPAFFYDSIPYTWRTFGTKKLLYSSAISSNGELEISDGSYLLEPFIYTEKQLLTYLHADASGFTDSLGGLRVQKTFPGIQMMIQPVIEDAADTMTMHVQYTVKNTGRKNCNGSFYLAIRPFQVSSRNMPGNSIPGIGRIEYLAFDGKKITVNNNLPVYVFEKPHAFGAGEFNQGDVVLQMRYDSLFAESKVKDDNGFATGALRYKFSLKPGEIKNYYFSIPLSSADFAPVERKDKGYTEEYYKKRIKALAPKAKGIPGAR